MNTQTLTNRPRVLAYWIAKKNHIFDEIAKRTNKKYDGVYLQLRRGNPRWKDRETYADTISEILNVRRVNEAVLFSPISEDEAVCFISTLTEPVL